MRKNILVLSILVLFVIACNSVAAEIPPGVTTEVPKEESIPSPTAAVCTSLPEGMEFDVQPVSESRVEVTVEGLEPGEMIKLLYERVAETTGPASTFFMEITPVDPIGAEGRYTETQGDLEPDEDGVTQWDIKLIHARGVACMRVELP